MDAPPIQYARTEDGVSIAYWTLGSGPALVIVHPGGISHGQFEWRVPEIRALHERLAGGQGVTEDPLPHHQRLRIGLGVPGAGVGLRLKP